MTPFQRFAVITKFECSAWTGIEWSLLGRTRTIQGSFSLDVVRSWGGNAWVSRMRTGRVSRS